MPFLHVRSLPLDPPFAPAEAVRAIAAAFAREVGVDVQHVTVTWQVLDAHRGQPLLVDLVAPDFNDDERIATMLRAAAAAVADAAGVAPRDVFVDFRAARPGHVFDGGEIVRW
jgi:hypothetical protein